MGVAHLTDYSCRFPFAVLVAVGLLKFVIEIAPLWGVISKLNTSIYILINCIRTLWLFSTRGLAFGMMNRVLSFEQQGKRKEPLLFWMELST